MSLARAPVHHFQTGSCVRKFRGHALLWPRAVARVHEPVRIDVEACGVVRRAAGQSQPGGPAHSVEGQFAPLHDALPATLSNTPGGLAAAAASPVSQATADTPLGAAAAAVLPAGAGGEQLQNPKPFQAQIPTPFEGDAGYARLREHELELLRQQQVLLLLVWHCVLLGSEFSPTGAGKCLAGFEFFSCWSSRR